MKKGCILFLFCLVFVFIYLCDREENSSDEDLSAVVNVVQTEKAEEKVGCEVYGVWLTCNEIGAMARGKSKEEYTLEVKELLSNLTEYGLNTVFYHGRAYCDALYESDLFPYSKLLGFGEGCDYDVLEIFLCEAEKAGVSVHLWINPYRVSYSQDLKDVKENPAVAGLYEKDKNSFIVCEKGVYLNPASSCARQLVLDGIREILDNYKVSGVHFDDYFYPECDDLGDERIYKDYIKAGGRLTLGEWRRENVNALVSSAFDVVKSYGDELIFSISPCGDIDKCKNRLYADVERWCREEGFADWMIPQLYYGFQNEALPYDDLLGEWSDLEKHKELTLLTGLAMYKCGNEDEYAGVGADEWKKDTDVISRQIKRAEANGIKGFVLFSYSWCLGENVNDISEKEIKAVVDMIK